MRILTRTSAGRVMRFQRRLLAIAAWLHGRSLGVRHGGCYPALLFRSKLEDIVGQKLAMVSFITVEGWRRGAGENPLIVLLPEQARGHGSSRAHRLRIGDPALDPVRL